MTKVFDVYKQGGLGTSAARPWLINTLAPASPGEDAYSSVTNEGVNGTKVENYLGWAYDQFSHWHSISSAIYARKTSLSLTNQFSGRFCIKPTNIGDASNVRIFQMAESGSSTIHFAIKCVDAAGTYTIQGQARDNADNTLKDFGSAISLTLSTWYQIIFRHKRNTANGAEFEVWSEDGQTQIGSTQTCSFTTHNGGDIVELSIGQMVSTSSYNAMFFSRLAIWDDWTLPAKMAAQVNVWQGTTTSWNTAGNWSLGRVPISTDIVEFSSGSQNCTIDVASVARMVRATSGYSGNFSSGGYSLTLDGGFEWKGTGSVTLDNSTITYDWLNVTSSASAFSVDGTTFIQQYAGTTSFGKTPDSSGRMTAWTIGSGCYVRTAGGQLFRNDGATSITLGNSNTVLHLTAGTITCYNSGTTTPIVDNGGTIKATTGNPFDFKPQTAGSIVTLPKFTSGGNLLVNAYGVNGQSCTYYLGADIACRQVLFSCQAANTTIVVNTNDKTITLAGSSGQLQFTIPSGAYSGCSITANFGSSVIDIANIITTCLHATSSITLNYQTSTGTRTAAESLTVSTGTLNVYFDSAQISHAANLTIGASTNVYNTAAKITFTAAATFATNGKSLPHTVLNASGAIIAVTGSATLARLEIKPGTQITTDASGTLTISAYTSGDWDGTAGSNTIIRSSSAGTKSNWTVPAGISTQYINVQDNAASNQVVDANGTLSNTTNWVTSAFSPAWAAKANRSMVETPVFGGVL